MYSIPGNKGKAEKLAGALGIQVSDPVRMLSQNSSSDFDELSNSHQLQGHQFYSVIGSCDKVSV